MITRKEHWENLYSTKQPNEVSWTEGMPKTSLDFIHSFHLSKSAGIIDIGGGDSRLVDYLLDEGFENITVLDISKRALDKAKQRLGERRAAKVKWIVSDILEFNPSTTYDVWHDRATFHFLITEKEIQEYLARAKKLVSAFMIIGTFSDKGPKKCSGLDVHRYSEEQLQKEIENGFQKIKCITEDHITPFSTKQNFLFCSFSKKQMN